MSETLALLDGNETARKRLLSIRGEPLFYADWDNVIFIHYQTDPQELQRCIPYHLDLYDGSAFVILSEATDLITGVANAKRLARDQSPWGRSLTAVAVRDDSALDARTT